MAVKPSQSAARVLQVFDYVARMQPVTITALAKATGVNMSALQRDLATLSEVGWIQQELSDGKTWELTHHIMTVARSPHSSRTVRAKLRPIMERLHDLVNEAVYFAVPHEHSFVVIDAIERPDAMGIVSPVGVVIPREESATGQAFLAAMNREQREIALGEPSSDELDEKLAQVSSSGYAINDGHVVPGMLTLASAVCKQNSKPVGAIVVTGPSDRITPDLYAEIGSHLRSAAMTASQLLHEDFLAESGYHPTKIAGLSL